jgi:CRP-like cAMP-binding protein
MIITVNSRPNALFILVNGSAVVEVLRGTPIAKLAAGDICGEMAFIESGAASASVVADSETEVEVLDLPKLTEIFSHHPHLEARFYKSLTFLLSRRLRATSMQLSKATSRP